MNNNKKINILIIMLGVILLILMFIIYELINNNYENNNKDGKYGKLEIANSNNEVEKNNDIYEETDIEVDVNDKVDEDKFASNKQKNDDNLNSFDNENNSNNFDRDATDRNINYTEDDVVSYFESNESEIKSGSFMEEFKDYFIEMVDFIFYGTEIKGYTFNDLTSTGKIKVISTALKIDSYIEEKSPGYKDNIKSSSSRVYSNVKEKLTTLFLDISSNICKNKEDGCSKAKEIFGDIKSTCKIRWSFIKNLLKSGSSKLKEWYEVYSGK